MGLVLPQVCCLYRRPDRRIRWIHRLQGTEEKLPLLIPHIPRLFKICFSFFLFLLLPHYIFHFLSYVWFPPPPGCVSMFVRFDEMIYLWIWRKEKKKNKRRNSSINNLGSFFLFIHDTSAPLVSLFVLRVYWRTWCLVGALRAGDKYVVGRSVCE